MKKLGCVLGIVAGFCFCGVVVETIVEANQAPSKPKSATAGFEIRLILGEAGTPQAKGVAIPKKAFQKKLRASEKTFVISPDLLAGPADFQGANLTPLDGGNYRMSLQLESAAAARLKKATASAPKEGLLAILIAGELILTPPVSSGFNDEKGFLYFEVAEAQAMELVGAIQALKK